MNEEDRELAGKCIQKIRRFHNAKQSGWKLRHKNELYLMMQPKLLRWVYSFFYKRMITIDEDERLSLTWEYFNEVLHKFDVDRARIPHESFFANFHRLMLYKLIAYKKKMDRWENMKADGVDPDTIPGHFEERERTWDFQEFKRWLLEEDPEMSVYLEKMIAGDLPKFSGNVYQWGKQRNSRKALEDIAKWLCTPHKWSKSKKKKEKKE